MEMDMDDPSTMLSGLLYMNMTGGMHQRSPNVDAKQSYFSDTLGTPLMMLQY